MVNWQRIVFLSLLLICFSFAHAAKPLAPESIEGVTIVSAEQLIELILNSPALVIIDSRYHEEYAKGRIEGSISIPDIDMTKAGLEKITKNSKTPIVFYCNGIRCLRSSRAATQAIQWGFKQVYWFRQGWVDWVKKQYPVEN